MQTSHKHSVSFVVPCLNEEKVLPFVLTKLVSLKESLIADRAVEIIVSDNGSTDSSVQIAESFGARVIHCPERGYGAALQCGIRGAQHEVVIFADADDTYDFLEAPRLIAKLDEGNYDMVLGSRMRGTIHDGAMPFLHRYIGTPVLSFIINALYSDGTYRLSDCNSGFRAFKKESFLSWNVRGSGMEFASEMLVKAMKSGAKLGEVPASLYPDKPGRTPHLRTWRDGMRHLLQILLESPEFFSGFGTMLWGASWCVLLLSVVVGQISIAGVSIFGVHSMMFALLGSILGLTVWSIGMFLAAKQGSSVRLYRRCIDMEEDTLFWQSFWVASVSFLLLIGIVFRWGWGGFQNLSLEKETLLVISFASNGLILTANIITAHLLKRT